MKKAKIERFLIDLQELNDKKIQEKKFIIGVELELLIDHYFPKREFTHEEKRTYKKSDVTLFKNTPLHLINDSVKVGDMVSAYSFVGLYPRILKNMLETNNIIFNNGLDEVFLYAYEMRMKGFKDVRYRIFTNLFYGLLSNKKGLFTEFIYDPMYVEPFSKLYLDELESISKYGNIVCVETDFILFDGEVHVDVNEHRLFFDGFAKIGSDEFDKIYKLEKFNKRIFNNKYAKTDKNLTQHFTK